MILLMLVVAVKVLEAIVLAIKVIVKNKNNGTIRNYKNDTNSADTKKSSNT